MRGGSDVGVTTENLGAEGTRRGEGSENWENFVKTPFLGKKWPKRGETLRNFISYRIQIRRNVRKSDVISMKVSKF